MSQTRRSTRPRPLALAALAGLAAAALTVPAAQAGPAPSAAPVVRTGAVAAADSARLSKQTAAHRAVEQLQRVFAPKSARAAKAQLSSDYDPTMALRNAWALRGSMSPADRAVYQRANGRPATTRVKCSAVVCVHWTPSETKTTFAMQTLSVMNRVHTTYVKAGYRGPKKDGKLGGNGKPDIYMDNIGNQGLYGYCTTDQQRLAGPGRYDVWAFCVLDNDYSRNEFPTNTPAENLKVTAAHEYYHANQFAYDILDDRWFLEATATWAEDQLYDSVDDNLQYLRDSPLTKPQVSLDNGAGGNLGVYGRWIFFRYISEHYKQKKGTLPKILLDFWKAADSSRGKSRNKYSSQAINLVLRTRGTTLAKTFAKFSDANLRPAQTYSEGKANRYPGAPVTPFQLRPAKKAAAGNVRLNHLSSASAALVSKGFGAGYKLRIKVNLGAQVKGSQAVITTYFKNGKTATKLVALNKAGDGSAVTAFASARVAGVALTLVNTSARFRCNRGTGFSCSGQPLDQRVVEQFKAVAFK